MKNDLVFTKWQQIYTDSLIIHEKLEIAHRDILRIIEKLIKDLRNYNRKNFQLKHQEIIQESTFTNRQWRTYKKYFLNKPAFSLLMMRLSGPRVFVWQREFNQAFYEMEQALQQHENASWIEARENWKLARKEETDTIKLFVDYATKQWSKKANMYYMNITKMTYKALELVNYNQPIREILNWIGLWFLMVAELKVIELLKQWMEDWLHYKEIYINARDWLQEFANLLPSTKKTFDIQKHII